MSGKDFYIIMTGAAPDKSYMETTLLGLHGFIRCVPDAKENGIIYGVGVSNIGDILSTSAMREAYEMGKSI